jgi:hypothetical protein
MAGIYTLYSHLVSSWILRYAVQTHLSQEDVASLINASFATISRSITAERFGDFSSIEQLLAYFKLCVRSVVFDELRREGPRKLREQSIEAIEDEPLFDDPAETVAAELEVGEFWRIVGCALSGTDERLVVQQICLLGRSPRELQQCYPAVFPEVTDIYRIKRNIMARLRRNHQLLGLLERRSSLKDRRSA